MAIPSIVLKTLFAPPHKTKNNNMSGDVTPTLRPRSLSCCIGNLFRKRFPSSTKLHLQGEKPKLPIEAYSITPETRLPSTFFATASDEPPPVYRTALTDDFVEQAQYPRLTFAEGILAPGLGLSQVPRQVVQGVINVPDSLSRRFAKEKEALQSLWLHQQQRQQATIQQPKAIADSKDANYVYDNNTGTTYRRGKLLGKGGFAKCYELIDVKSNKTYAGKIISKNRLTRPRQMEKIIREVELHSCLHHPNVVEFRSFFEDQDNVYMVLENCSRKTMIHMLKARKVLTEPEVRYYMRQLVEGCQYVHSKRVIHRDLKLGNMLVNENMQLKVADFGLATRVEYEGEKKMTVCGTPNYIAPEVLEKKGHSYEADTWALGCIMYALLCGRPPFETTSLKETYARITTNKFHVPSHISTTARDLICKLLHPEPRHRPKLDRILDEPFFTTGFTPPCLPTSCCEFEPKFTVTRNIRPESCAPPVPQRSEMRAIVSSIEQAVSLKPKTLATQRTSRPEINVPVSSDVSRSQSLRSEVAPPFVQPRKKLLYQKQTGLWPEKANAVAETGTGADVELLHQQVVSLQRKEIRRAAAKQFIPEFLEAAERKQLNFVKGYACYEQQPELLATKDQLAYPRKCPSMENGYSTPKQNWISPKNLKQEKVFSACSPIRLFQALSRCLEVMPPDFNPTPVQNCKPLWVTKWVDYSNKYGFGFQLSDRTVGILFNDTTRMILSNDSKTLVYNDLSNKIVTFTTESAPPEQRKKVTLLLYFIQYMNEHLINSEELTSSVASSYSNAVFMKKWFRTDKAVVMYLNNGTLQVNFLVDHTKLIIGVDGQDYLVTYIDAERQVLSYRLLQLSHFGCSIQLDERLRYARRMLENVMNLKGEAV